MACLITLCLSHNKVITESEVLHMKSRYSYAHNDEHDNNESYGYAGGLKKQTTVQYNIL